MAPRRCADSPLSSFAREQCNRKSLRQLGKFYVTTAKSRAGHMIDPFAPWKFHFSVAPIAAEFRHQPRHDRDDRFTANECDDVLVPVSANFERLDSRPLSE